MTTSREAMNPSAALRPLGRPIPDSPHAVSVSLPTWADVIGYEEGDRRVLDQLACGYPRFVFHPRVKALMAAAEAEAGSPHERALVLPTAAAAERCRAFLAIQGVPARIAPWRGLAAVLVPLGAESCAKPFWQHTGEIVSSRRAEAVLAGQSEAPGGVEAKAAIAEQLARLTGTRAQDVRLFPSGMAALAQALRLIPTDRPTAQFGFPYLDSLKLQQRFGAGAHFYPHGDEGDLEALEARLRAGEVGAVFCEVPSNPLMRSPDLPRLAAATRAAGVPLVLDDSIATFYNLDLKPYADVLVSSLTKNFSGGGEAMGGALVLNPESPLFESLHAALAADYEDMLFGDDAMVIAKGAADFEARMAVINLNAERLADALAAHPAVAQVYFPKVETPALYQTALRPHGGFGGVLSLVLVDGARAPGFFDRLQVDKGPSFGLRTTLACPYTLLAHYTELDWAEACGVSRHLIRVSVGTEDPEALIRAFTGALDAA